MKQFAPFHLDTANECLWREGAQIALQPKPYAVLRYLVENPGRLITHDELLDALWPDTFVQPQVLRTYMLELRKILGDDAGQPRFIQTLPKRGYCFVARVVEVSGPQSGAMSASGSETAQDSATLSEIVGRDAELSRLESYFQAAASGRRQIVFIAGEAGIGKTALTDAFGRQAAVAGLAIVARGQCVPGFGSQEAFYPVIEALGQLCASADGEAVCRILSQLAPAWLALLGRQPAAAADAMSPGPPADRLPGSPGSLCLPLEELASARPLLLIFEDLQWADSATLNLISALARRRAPAKLMVLATYRSRSVAADHPLKPLRQELLMQRLTAELALEPLDKPAILKLLNNLLGRELHHDALPQRVCDFVCQRAEGNPLFAIAILQHLVAQDLLLRRQIDGTPQWRLSPEFDETSAGLPDELAQMVELEIERLTREQQHVLEAGSLMNIAFPAWAVAAALERDLAEIEDACEALARGVHFVERAGQDELPGGASSAFYVFSHGLYREALYRRQAAARRAARHVRIAERLGEIFRGREVQVAREMALHYEAAGNWQRGAQALHAAALYAAERNSHAEAAELLDRALRMTEDGNASRAEARELRAQLEEARGNLAHAAK